MNALHRNREDSRFAEDANSQSTFETADRAMRHGKSDACHFQCHRAQTGEYENPQEFNGEVHESVLRARGFHEAGGDAYGSTLLLQVSRVAPYIRVSQIVQSDFIEP